jgi:PPIC-type peptidyl-prolyl cis-trans isomerase-like protein
LKRKRPVVAALVALVALSCGEAAPPAITVGPVAYTQDQLLGLSDARKADLVRLTAFALAVSDSTTDVLGASLVDRWAEDRLFDILAADLTLEKNGVGDDVLEAQYLTDPEWELTVRHILFFSERWRSSEHRAEAAAKAARAMELLRGGADFAETAATLSEEPGAEGRQGLLEPGREGSWVPEFWAAALALQPGDISPVTETQYGYHILRLDDRLIVPFVEGRSVIARDIADRIEDPAAVLSAWLEGTGAADEESRRAAVLVESGARGLSVPDGERAELARAWDNQTYQWANQLGLSYGLTSEGVGAAALAALANPAQNAGLARSALAEHDALLRDRYEITMAEGSG